MRQRLWSRSVYPRAEDRARCSQDNKTLCDKVEACCIGNFLLPALRVIKTGDRGPSCRGFPDKDRDALVDRRDRDRCPAPGPFR